MAVQHIQPFPTPFPLSSSSPFWTPGIFDAEVPTTMDASAFGPPIDSLAAIMANTAYTATPHEYAGIPASSGEPLVTLPAFVEQTAIGDQPVAPRYDEGPPLSSVGSEWLMDPSFAQSGMQMPISLDFGSKAREYCSICRLPIPGIDEEEMVCHCFEDPASYLYGGGDVFQC